MADLFSYGNLTGQALHLSLGLQQGDVFGDDGVMTQPVYLSIVPLVDIPAGLCPALVDSLLLAPEIVSSEPAEKVPRIEESLALSPRLSMAEDGEDRPEITSTQELTPSIKGTKGRCSN